MRVLASGRTVRGKKFGESREGEKERGEERAGGRGRATVGSPALAKGHRDEERERIAGVSARAEQGERERARKTDRWKRDSPRYEKAVVEAEAAAVAAAVPGHQGTVGTAQAPARCSWCGLHDEEGASERGRARERDRKRERERVSEGARRKFIGGESRDGRTECRGWSRGAGAVEVDEEEEE